MEEGRHRRSARLSALDKCKQEKAPCGGVPKVEKRAEDGKETGRGQGLPGKKRGRKKKKLEEVEEVVVNSVDKVVGEVCFFLTFPSSRSSTSSSCYSLSLSLSLTYYVEVIVGLFWGSFSLYIFLTGNLEIRVVTSCGWFLMFIWFGP